MSLKESWPSCSKKSTYLFLGLLLLASLVSSPLNGLKAEALQANHATNLNRLFKGPGSNSFGAQSNLGVKSQAISSS